MAAARIGAGGLPAPPVRVSAAPLGVRQHKAASAFEAPQAPRLHALTFTLAIGDGALYSPSYTFIVLAEPALPLHPL